jgi:hypothetical protein
LDKGRHRSRGKRVRVVTDDTKYRRHRRKKWLRKATKVAGWAAVVVLIMLVGWFLLNRITQPPPQE